MPLIGTSLISLENSILALGGGYNLFYKSIYELHNLQFWQELRQKLQVERNFMIAMLVPDDIADC